MKNCLIILNPREIPECIQSFKSLKIDKFWLTGFTEPQLVTPINEFIRKTEYDNYLIGSDDLEVTQDALDVVEELLEAHEMATGYCLLSEGSSYTNATRKTLKGSLDQLPTLGSYGFYLKKRIDKRSEPEFESWFGGWTLTGMRRNLWLKHPFQVHPLNQKMSDYASQLGIGMPFACHRNAYCRHVRSKTHQAKDFIVGKVNPMTRHEKLIDLD